MIAWGGVVAIVVALVDGQGRRGSGEAEIEQLGDRRGGGPAAPDEEDIARFQVAMDDPLPVGRGQRVGHLDRDPQRFVERQARSLGARACASALQCFPSRSSMTRNAVPASSPTSKSVQMFGWVSREMVRASRSKRSRNCGSAASAVGEDLDRDGAIETRVSAFVHLAHAARADLRGNFVDAEARTGGEGQTLVVDYTAGWQRGRDYS